MLKCESMAAIVCESECVSEKRCEITIVDVRGERDNLFFGGARGLCKHDQQISVLKHLSLTLPLATSSLENPFYTLMILI